ncbi:hypothetical protein QBC39DRAFT_2818 [Podospora conica]|nr:hypothetical protein QBC39DRAFT_2818 [Schizothecium conicum]
MHRGLVFFFLCHFSVSPVSEDGITVKEANTPSSVGEMPSPRRQGGQKVSPRPVHRWLYSRLLYVPRDGWMHSKRSKRNGDLSWSLATPLHFDMDGEVLCLSFVLWRGKCQGQESLAQLREHIPRAEHAPSNTISQTQKTYNAITTQGRIEYLIPPIQQGQQPTTVQPTPPSNRCSLACPGEYEREERTTKKVKIAAVSWVIRRGPLSSSPPSSTLPSRPAGRPSLSHIINMYHTTHKRKQS